MFKIIKLLLLASLLGMPFFTYSQQFEFQGRISDSLYNSVPNAIVIISVEKNESNILAYNSTNENGQFKVIVKSNITLDSVFLTIKHIAYKTLTLKIPFQSTNRNFILSQRLEQLQEVLLKSDKVVEVKGDTITYNINALKTKKDYTIEEVIDRIPGVTIEESGQIKYEGKPISHLYINGLDLLEGRYNIATQGIPADAVKEIDIMKNHNHARIDIGRADSDNVAFNLKIKDNVNLVFGSVKGDLGVPLVTGMAEGTPIYLKDKFQNINSIKLNNIGKTLRNIGNDLTSGDPNIFGLKMDETSIIKPPNINGVVLSDKYWLNNDSYAITNDALHKISDSTLLKWNINYNNELSKIENESFTTFIVNNDSTNIANISRNQLRSQRFQIGLNQEINKSNFYLRNNSILRFKESTGIEDVILNESPILADFQNSNTQFGNSTLLKSLIGNGKILQSGLIIEYSEQNEQLQVAPPVFENVIGQTTFNESTLQNIGVTKFNIGGFADYAFDWLNLKWNAQQKIQYNHFNFNSHLKQLPQFEDEDFPFTGNFNFQRLLSTTRINSKLNLGKLKFSWRFSADFIDLNTTEKNLQNGVQNSSFLFFQPQFTVNYEYNSRWNLGISYYQNNKISDFSDLYQSVVLKNYNSLVQNPRFVNRLRTKSISPSINYSNILRSFIFKISGQYNNNKSDITFVNQLNDQGFFITEVINRPNNTNNYGVSLSLTKGLSRSFKTDLSYSYNYSETELFFNNQFLISTNAGHSIDLGVSWDKGSWYALDYKIKLNTGTSELPNNKVNNLFLFQTTNLNFYTGSKTRLNVGLESARTNTSSSPVSNINTLFNTSFYYEPSKKIFFKASLLNIFDTPFFTTTNSSVNFVNFSQFSLRPRQFTIGLTYSL
jgi:hypothetical protein